MKLSEKTWVSLFLLVVGAVLFGLIYLAAKWNCVAGAIVLGIGYYIWCRCTYVASDHSDPAGDGMAEGFHALFDIALSIIYAVTFLLFMLFSNPVSVFNISMIVLLVVFVKRYLFYIFNITFI
ncbi:MAG: hypothetical protein IKQ70_14640 [Bacteroidales bacterium]|nr:hypothetical protein [Bacteroidales bacterium]